MIYQAIKNLVQYGLDTGLITEEDRIYATNQILDVLKMDEYEEPREADELPGLVRYKADELSDAPAQPGYKGILGPL